MDLFVCGIVGQNLIADYAPNWASQLICSQCGSHNTDFIVAPDSTAGSGRPLVLPPAFVRRWPAKARIDADQYGRYW